MMRASTKRVRIGLLACAIVAAGLSLASSPAKDIFGGPNSGPTNFVTVRDGTQIAVNVRMPKPYIKGHRYPAIIDMSGYVGGSSTGPTLPGELGGPSAPSRSHDGVRLDRRYLSSAGLPRRCGERRVPTPLDRRHPQRLRHPGRASAALAEIRSERSTARGGPGAVHQEHRDPHQNGRTRSDRPGCNRSNR